MLLKLYHRRERNKGDLSAHFSKKEFACRCGCGKCDPVPELVTKLEKFRELCGNQPLHINSVCRCEKHNAKVGGSPKSQHKLGHAADVRKIHSGKGSEEQAPALRPDTPL